MSMRRVSRIVTVADDTWCANWLRLPRSLADGIFWSADIRTLPKSTCKGWREEWHVSLQRSPWPSATFCVRTDLCCPDMHMYINTNLPNMRDHLSCRNNLSSDSSSWIPECSCNTGTIVDRCFSYFLIREYMESYVSRCMEMFWKHFVHDGTII